MSTVEGAWAILDTEGRREPGWHLRRVGAAAACEILAGVRRPDGARGLILEVSADAVPSDLDLPQSRGFAVEPQLVGPSHSGRARFTLVLTDSAYAAVYAVLCEDTVLAAAGASTPRAALRQWIGRLHVWQEFMARQGPGGLPEEAVVGLVGELLVLRDHLAPRIGGSEGVRAWAGPRGEPNDFELGGGFLEVKATTRQVPSAVAVSNLDQLDDGRGPILLAHLRLRRAPSGRSLPSLVSEIRDLLAGEGGGALDDFRLLLTRTGYAEAQAHLYPAAYEADRTDFYRVAEGFPRLARAILPEGVLSCAYQIDLAACAPFAVPEGALDRLTGRSRHG